MFLFHLFIAETFRILSRGKGSVCRKDGGDRTLSRHCRNDSTIIISYARCNRSLRWCYESKLSTWCREIIEGTRYGPAACMIIENYPPLPTRSRHNSNQDTIQHFLNHLVLPKHRTSKFSSNRHRKLHTFRET